MISPVNYNFEAFEKTNLFLHAGTCGAEILRWSMILDVFGFYLLLLPAVVVLWAWLKPQGEIKATFFSLCGLSYIIFGAAGASILAAVWPPLINTYAQASGHVAESTKVIFNTITNVVTNGLWNGLDPITSGIWWTGIGFMLRKHRRAPGIYTIVLGVVSLLSAVGGIAKLTMLASFSMNLFFVLAPVWAIWFGIDLLRRPIEK